MARVYLAGPLAGVPYSAATEWRKAATVALAPIEALSPLRGRTGPFAEQDHMGTATPYRASSLVGQDRFDVRTCDVVLMNLLELPTVSVGTMVELGWADAWRKPVVLVIPADHPLRGHPFLHHLAEFKASTLEAGVRIVKRILGVEP